MSDQNPCLFPLSTIVEPLLDWYEQNKRSLPWRDEPTPYHVWLSEIMLQQTRIEAVLPYYARFLEACPTVADLSAISDDALMKLWQGLGYYSRARNLKKAACLLMEQYDGEFPADYAALRSLPGVGEYTAGAIASIAFGLPEPAVDGNVLRVVTRLSGDAADITQPATKRRITQELRAVYPQEPPRAAAMTQAIMELGQRVCIPNGRPHCESCPLGLLCTAHAAGTTDCIPNRPPKKPRRVEQHTVLLIESEAADGTRRYLIRKRPSQGLLSGLWEFPCLDSHLSALEAQTATESLFGALCSADSTPAPNAIHIFTHIEWHMVAHWVRVHADTKTDEAVWATAEELQELYAIPGAFRTYLQAVQQREKERNS